MVVDLTYEEMDEFHEDDRFEISEDLLKLSHEELNRRAEEVLREHKANPRFPKVKKDVPDCFKY